MLNKLLTYLKLCLITLSVLLLCYLLAAATFSVIPTSTTPTQCQKKQEVYVSSNGIHLDLIIPRELLPSKLLVELNPPDWVTHLVFGWGDREFYINTPTWDDLDLWIAMKALFINSESAMHVAWVSRIFPKWEPVLLCKHQLQSLLDYLERSFKKGSNNQIMEIKATGYTDQDRFYQANGSFSLIQTCNNWVNGALKAAEVRTSIWSPFDLGVLYQVRKSSGKLKKVVRSGFVI